MADGYLVDTNVLLRWLDKNSQQNTAARSALKTLHRRGENLFVTSQNLIEFWSIATRAPGPTGGLGMANSRAQAKMRHLRRFFSLLPDMPAIYETWQDVVTAAGVTGVLAHDARLVACMQVYGITHVLTFNVRDFQRFPNITVIDPATL